MNSIDIFPNTGHYFSFVPIENGSTDEEFLKKWLICTGRPWANHPELSWVRIRPGYSTGILGLWISVESNLGKHDRGIALEPLRPIEEKPVEEHGYDESWSPYAFKSMDQLPPNGVTNLPNVVISDPTNDSVALWEFELPEIHWLRNQGDSPIPVDLIVDFGNTRTTALLFEDDENRPLNEICRPLRFVPRGSEIASSRTYSIDYDPLVMVDSWIVLREGIFSNIEPPSAEYHHSTVVSIEQRQVKKMMSKKNVNMVVAEQRFLPQMFVEISPSIMGGGMGVDSARQILKDADMDSGSNFFLSSPKRYIWDGDQMGKGGRSYWNVERMPWSTAAVTGLPRLEGPIMLHMDTDGRYWDIEEESPPCEREDHKYRPKISDNATFPRRDAMTWAALTIIEAAHRQINSEDYRRARRPFMKRKLRNVVVTFPAGWTAEEIAAYRAQWQKAISAFTVAHKDPSQRGTHNSGGDRPELITDLDEAVASQIPIIYSENQRMPGGESWIELMGKGVGTEAKSRVMNIDIGGGTCDVAVVEYQDTLPGAPIKLNAKLLFKNSNNIAGDRLVQELIERALLPLIGRRFSNEPEKSNFEQLFRHPASFSHFDPAIRIKVARAVRLVFMPIIFKWLSDISDENGNEGAVAVSEIVDADGSQLVDLGVLEELNHLFRLVCENENISLIESDEPLKYDAGIARRCIAEVFQPLFKTFSKIVSAFDCDQIYVSGKTSELPEIQRLIRRYMPVVPERIVFARGYHAGDWYPYGASNGTITDAKTLTVVGAALVQAIKKRRVKDWDIEITQEFMLSEDNFWGIMSDSASYSLFAESVFLSPGENEITTDMLINSRIGRARFLSPILDPDQIYVLRWKPYVELPSDLPTVVRVKIRRTKVPGAGESLTLEAVETSAQHSKVSLDHIELQLCTLPDGEFWMDNPKFEVVWDADNEN